MSPQAWTAIWAGALFVAALALLCFGPPAWEAIRAGQYRRETARLGAAKATIEPGTEPAHARPRRSPFARLRSRNERIIREREARRG